MAERIVMVLEVNSGTAKERVEKLRSLLPMYGLAVLRAEIVKPKTRKD